MPAPSPWGEGARDSGRVRAYGVNEQDGEQRAYPGALTRLLRSHPRWVRVELQQR